jgi:hypothetical protein
VVAHVAALRLVNPYPLGALRKMILYRPVGPRELELIAEMEFRGFPPRLPEQPIFYPVLHVEYAEQIARDWNANDPNQAGFVTKFEVDDDWIGQFDVQTVGKAGLHDELWVPAERLEEFNSHIIGNVTVEAAFYGDGFTGEIDPQTNLPTTVSESYPA